MATEDVKTPEKPDVRTLQNTPISATDRPSKRILIPTAKARECARLVIAEGKPFVHAAVQAGYSQNVADAGPRDLMNSSPGFGIALAEESKKLPDANELLALSVRTLVADIRAGRSRGLEKTIETLGKFKHHDWFVRNSDMNMGIFLALGEQPPEQALSDDPDKYHE